MVKKAQKYEIVVKVHSRTGERPLVRTIGGDTVFISLVDGQTATWSVKRVKPVKVKPN